MTEHAGPVRVAGGRGGSPIRVARALWRYRGQVAAHGEAYQSEVATAVRTAIDSTAAGRVALRGYRLAMRLLIVAIVVLVLITLGVAALLWQLTPWAAVGAIVPAIGAGLVTWWRLSWGAPLDWLDEFADPSRSVTVAELPARLTALAAETRSMANMPARVADELDALAREAATP